MNVPFVPGGRNSFPSGFSQLFSRMGLNSIELAQCQEAEGTESLSQPPSPEMATASLRPVSCPYWSVLHCPSFLSEESFPLLLCLSPSCSLRHLENPPHLHIGLPRWFSGKESTCQCRRCRRRVFNPWVRKIPWRRKW